jgi:hypothetical protein
MKMNWLKISGALSLVMTSALVTACGAGDMNELGASPEELSGEEGGYSDSAEMELGSSEQASHNCATPDGTNAVMAALAVAAAQDLGRWNAGVDFQVINGDRIGLTSGTGPDNKPKGSSRCGGNCRRIAPLLALQYDNATGVYIQAENSTTKVLVNPAALRSRMKAKLEEQRTVDVNAKDGTLNLAPRTGHSLTANGAASNLGGCGPHFKFNVAFDATMTTPKPVPAQLRYKLYFADQANGWVDFRDLGNNVVAIDPTYGLNEGSTTTAGSCEIACSKVSPNSSMTGACCSCGGIQKTFKQSTFSTAMFLCQ